MISDDFFEEFHGKIPENNSEEIFGAIPDGIPAYWLEKFYSMHCKRIPS